MEGGREQVEKRTNNKRLVALGGQKIPILFVNNDIDLLVQKLWKT